MQDLASFRLMISMVDYEQNSATAPQNYFPVVNLQIQQNVFPYCEVVGQGISISLMRT